MSNKEEYERQLTDAGIPPDLAEKVADAAVATDEGRERTEEEHEACKP